MGISNDCANQQSNGAKLYIEYPTKIRIHNDFIMALCPSGVVGIIKNYLFLGAPTNYDN